ncbi:NAD(P)-dependent oxidoreductase [Ornithinimicrobium faecis]|uniref:NAD(P)-dependent oxidoreductase n=1 Tax=Ornithinimicrobium faecis TaxID=2934158 RepID=UPI00211773EF|nr:NAD(P)-binding domain-containing protein [Ornithinimicrobium sp. HY1745]
MTTQHAPVSVLGLGSMGIALARALLRAGVPTTVWNRTSARTRPLAGEGARVAPGLDAAVAASDLVIVCLRDHDAVREVLGGLDPSAYEGRVVVNLSSSTPGEGRASAAWAADQGITYLNGAIMVPTMLIGDPEALILYSGNQVAFDRAQDRLRPLAGLTTHLGSDPGQAALYDVAMLEIFFASMTSFLHATAMVTASGITAREFLPFAQQMAALGGTVMEGLAADVDVHQFDGTEDTLEMELAALDHIVHTSDEAGLDGTLARHMRDLVRRAVDAGHGADAFSRVVEMVRHQP